MKNCISIGAIMAAVSVILGAFGAHYLKTRLGFDQLVSFETGVKYLMYHGLAVIIIGLLQGHFLEKNLTFVKWLFFVGSVLFSGSIFFLSTREWTGWEFLKFLGPITPLGGLCLISGWIILAYKFIKN